MLATIALIQTVGFVLPTVTKVVTKAWLALSAASGRHIIDEQLVFEVEDLFELQRSTDADRVRAIVKQARVLAALRAGDEHCGHCGHAKSSLRYRSFNGQALMSAEEISEINESTDADRVRAIIGVGRKRAEQWRAVDTRKKVFKSCPKCGAALEK